MMLAGTMVGVCEALLLAHKAGLDCERLLDLMKNGGAASQIKKDYGTRMLHRDFGPGFYIEYFVKDLGIVLDECRRLNIAVPGNALAYQFYTMMMAKGRGRMGYHALLTVLEDMNDMQVRDYSKK